MDIDEILQNVLAENDSAFFYTPSVYGKSKSYFFLTPVEIVETSDPGDVPGKLKRIDKLIKKGLHGYGCISYEAGFLFEERLKHLCPDKTPLLKFCFFRGDDVQVFKSKDLQINKWNDSNFGMTSFRLDTPKEKYISDINKIKNYIAEGDTYQVNYTVKGMFEFYGAPISLFKKLIFNQSSRYSAIINSGNNIIMSLSPELFFHIEKNKITTMPMKGTAERGFNNEEDEQQLRKLGNSEKNKAENLMIVDLLRNDLGRISQYGSVRVSNLFEIEKYESLFQKISTVKANLKEGTKFSGVIRNTFPCGSITGAPKIRTMEIINELETGRRGIYTGGIGLLLKDEAVFNVAIRTITINKETGNGRIGIGSGIVWDSSPEKEFDEALLKAEFFVKSFSYFEIYETMLAEMGEIFLLSEHINRMKAAAGYFLFNFNEKKILKAISKKLKKLDKNEKFRIRVLLNKWGAVTIEVKDYPINPDEINVIVSAKRISADDKFRYFKTTNRQLYDDQLAEYSAKGFFDVIFLNNRGQICEGARTNIFIRKAGEWYTPPVNAGLLEGVFRNYWLKNNPGIKEEHIYLQDLRTADEIILTNSLRGIIKVDKLYLDEDQFVDLNNPREKVYST
ncbi:MAG: aminodeoxychorismate synthase component I [Ignavibacteriaceae bacterium]